MSHDELALLRGEGRVLEMVATGASLRDTLEALTALIEAQEHGLRCGVMVVAADGGHFSEGFGPSLPAFYHEALAGLPITPPYVGACGEAAHTGVPVVVSNVAEAGSYSEKWRELLAACNIVAMCSTPIIGSDQGVLGSFAFHRDTLGDPQPADLRLVAVATHLAAIALERARHRQAVRGRERMLEASEARLRDSEEQHRLVIESAKGFAIITLDMDGTITGWNPGAERVLGYSKAEAVGQPGAMLFTPEDAAAGVDARELERARRDGQAENERWHVRRDGSRFWASGLAMPLTNGQQHGYLQIFQDKTAEHQMAEQLRDRETEAREAQRMARIGSWRWFAATDATTGSEEMYRIFGLDPAKPFPDFAAQRGTLYPAHEWERINAGMQHAMATGERCELDVRALRQGEAIWVTKRCEPVRDDDGDITILRGTVQDITERKHAEVRHEYLLRLDAALREQDGPQAMAETATAMLGQQLDAAQVGFGEIDDTQDHITVRYEWNDGRIPSVARTWRMDDFGPAFIATMKAGHNALISDVRLDPRTNDAASLSAFEGVGIRALLDVPLIRAGRMTALLFIHHPEPRQWAPDEETLVEQTGKRLWDAVERARAETALAESEAFLRSIFNASTDCFKVIERDGTLTFINDQGLRLLETEDLAALRGTDYASHWPGKGADRVRAGIAAALDGAEVRFEGFCPSLKGTPKWWDMAIAPVRDAEGRVARLLSVSREITDRKVAEAALAESQARLEAIVSAVPVGIVMAEAPSGRVTYGNAAVERVFRHPLRHSATVDGYREWEAYHPDGSRVAGHEFTIARVLATGQPAHGEYHYACGDGVRRWISSIGVPLRDGSGVLTGAVVVCTDIDEVKQATAVLARSKAELEQLVDERTRDLREAQSRLAHAQRMEALGQLAGGIAHDFNNVMQAVQGGAGLIRRRAGDAQTVDHLARMVEEAAQRGASITRRLLAFARRGELRAEAVDPEALLEGLHEMLAHTLEAGIQVRVEVAPEPGEALPALLADKGQLETVLVNLASNARDAMPRGGTVVLSAAVERVGAGRKAHTAGLRPGSYIRLAVSDTGEGMSAEVLARASEPFFTTKDTGKGTGLGLAMARGFAEQSGGAFGIRSTPGAGTTVTIWMPVTDGLNIGEAKDDQEARATRAAAARVLVVDDEDLVREVVAQGLEERGYQALRARSGAAALAVLDAGAAVDVLLTDYAMPGIDGLALIAEARRRRPGLPAVLLTGNAGGQVEAQLALDGLAGGAFSLLRKPVGADQLAERIGMLVEKPNPELV